jgi:AcrR family transcriptional regulator
MAGYRPPPMTKTPWGDTDSLRERKLRPGQRLPAEDVARNQRQRLFAAVIAVVAEKGYAATRVADLLELSGVSRSAFYEHFKDKQECMLAAIDALVNPAIAAIQETGDTPQGEDQSREALTAFLQLLVDQSAAARTCLVELYAVGPGATAMIDKGTDAFQGLVSRILETMPERQGMPPEIVRGMLGGFRKVIHTRLYRGEEDQLVELAPDLWSWAASYRPPPQPLRRPRTRPPERSRMDGYDPAERILRAFAAVVAEKGYLATTVNDVATRASISLSTFYANFTDKEEAMLATTDSAYSQMLATTLPAFRRAHDWPNAVRNTATAMFAFCAAEPEYTKTGTIDVYAAGQRALEQRDQVMQGMETLLVPGYEREPNASPLAGEAITGAIYEMIYHQVKLGGAESMQEITPLATYMALAPFVGAHEACIVANGDGRSAR